MKFKLAPRPKTRHTQCVTAIGWAAGDHLYTIGDDSKILRWNVSAIPHTSQEVGTLPEGVYATDMQWFSGSDRKHGRGAHDTFAMAGSDGKFYFVSSAGRIEKVVEAHKGATVCLRWSPDGTTLATGGEDGAVKIWSRAGMQRTVLAQKPNTIYGIAWSADSESLVFCSRELLCIKQLTPGGGGSGTIGAGGSKPNEWTAHDALILAVDWSAANGRICSGGEDRTYRVWDALGRLLFTSMQEEQPVTSLAWSPDGTMLAVGSFNMLRLCDAGGISHHADKLEAAGSLYRLAWSGDNTKLAAGSALGFVLLAEIVLKSLSWNAVRATLVDVDKISVIDVHGEINQILELPQSIVYFSLGFDHLIVSTRGKLHIFSLKHLTTPTVFDIKNASATSHAGEGGGGVLFIVQAQTHFVAITSSGVYVYSYQGRLVCQPHCQNIPSENLSPKTLGLNQAFLALVDRAESRKRSSIRLVSIRRGSLFSCNLLSRHKLPIPTQTNTEIYVYDALNGREACEPIEHSEQIVQLGIDQSTLSPSGGAQSSASFKNCGFVSFIDASTDLFIAPIVPSGVATTKSAVPTTVVRDSYRQPPRKVGSTVSSAQWHSHHAVLAFIEQQTTLKLITHPLAAFVLKGELLLLATFSLQQQQRGTNNTASSAVDLGRQPQIESFIGTRITIRRSDGGTAAAAIHIGVPVHLIVLHEQLAKSNWSGALKICRMSGDNSLWAACAAHAVHSRQLDAAAAAFAALKDFPKVEALQNISRMGQDAPANSTSTLQKAELSIFAADFYDAETLLLQSGMILRAIMMHVDMFNWQRALQVAQRYKKSVDVVVGCRQKYLKTIGKQEEVLPEFAALNNAMKIDWASVEATLKQL